MSYFLINMCLNLIWLCIFGFEKGSILVCFGVNCALHFALSLSAMGTGQWDKFWSPFWVTIVSGLICWAAA